MSNKKVCVINRETNMITRVDRISATALINNGYSYTTKSALKKFMNRDMKYRRNEKTFNRALDHKNYRGKKKNLALVLLSGFRGSIIKWYPISENFGRSNPIIRKRQNSEYKQMLLTD